MSRLRSTPPWYPTIAAFEVHDSNRTHLYDCAHFTGSMSGTNQVFAYSSPLHYPTPYNIVDEGWTAPGFVETRFSRLVDLVFLGGVPAPRW